MLLVVVFLVSVFSFLSRGRLRLELFSFGVLVFAYSQFLLYCRLVLGRLWLELFTLVH